MDRDAMTIAAGAAGPFPGIHRNSGDAAEHGFSLVEFMIGSLILVLIGSSVFALLAQIQRTAARQAEVQEVLDGMRMALLSLRRILEQAGNDPANAGFPGVEIISAEAVRVRSDLTGSGGAGSPAEGDPDGDVDDPGEDVGIRYDRAARSIDLAQGGAVFQPLAGRIASFRMEFFDRGGAVTNNGDAVRMIRITLIGATPSADPQTGRVFSVQLSTDIRLANR